LKNKQRFDIILTMKENQSFTGVLARAKQAEAGVLNFFKSHPKELAIAMMAVASLPVLQLRLEMAMAWGLPVLALVGALYLPNKPESSLK
jgi:hypothetical protein